jgi:hypothetical protein
MPLRSIKAESEGQEVPSFAATAAAVDECRTVPEDDTWDPSLARGEAVELRSV